MSSIYENKCLSHSRPQIWRISRKGKLTSLQSGYLLVKITKLSIMSFATDFEGVLQKAPPVCEQQRPWKKLRRVMNTRKLDLFPPEIKQLKRNFKNCNQRVGNLLHQLLHILKGKCTKDVHKCLDACLSVGLDPTAKRAFAWICCLSDLLFGCCNPYLILFAFRFAGVWSMDSARRVLPQRDETSCSSDENQVEN